MAQENNKSNDSNEKKLRVTANGYCSVSEWAESEGLNTQTVVNMCKKHNARVVKIGNTRMAPKNELDRVYQSEITAQDNIIKHKKQQAAKTALYKQNAVKAAVQLGPKGVLEITPEDFDSIKKVLENNDSSLAQKFKERKPQPVEERAQLKAQINELLSLYKKTQL